MKEVIIKLLIIILLYILFSFILGEAGPSICPITA